jgi:hypothetical protein
LTGRPADEEEDEGDMLRYGPRPDRLIAKSEGLQPAGGRAGAATAGGRGASQADAADGGKAGVYRPPRLNPVSMET